MSWQEYIDKQLIGSGCVCSAAIVGTDGVIWAKSDNFVATHDELKILVAGFDNQKNVQESGVRLNNVRYVFIAGTDTTVRYKMNKTGLHCSKTKKAVIVSIYDETVQPEQTAVVVEKLADYLRDCGC